jgi:hypothetical protein
MGLGALWRLLAGAVGSLIGGNSESRQDFSAINDALERMNDKLRTDNERFEERCHALQVQVDKLVLEVATLTMANLDVRIKLAECEARHVEDQRRIVDLERQVQEIQQA